MSFVIVFKDFLALCYVDVRLSTHNSLIYINILYADRNAMDGQVLGDLKFVLNYVK